jgi:hypothetical protein
MILRWKLTPDPWKTTYVPCPETEEIIDYCLRAIRRHARHKDSQGIYLIGEAGAGKSAILRALTRRVNNEFTGEGSLPAIMINMPVPCTNRAISLELRRALGDPAKSGSATDNLGVFRELCPAMGTRVLSIDETHNIGEDKHDFSQSRRHFMKRMMNDFRGICIFGGTPPLLPVMESDRELKRRMRRTLYVLPYDLKVPEGRTSFRRYLSRLDVAAGLPESSELSAVDRAMRIGVATAGLRGSTFEFIDYARDLALDDGSRRILDEHLKQAFFEFIAHDDPKVPNPFDVDRAI